MLAFKNPFARYMEYDLSLIQFVCNKVKSTIYISIEMVK